MEKKQREDAVYVTGLPDDVTTEKLAELFGSIGVIKINRKTNGPTINLYNDKSGKFKVRIAWPPIMYGILLNGLGLPLG